MMDETPMEEAGVDPLDEAAEDDETFEIVEPKTATRLSPYAVAAFVVAMLGAYEALGATAQLWTAFGTQLGQHLVARLVPAGALPAIWAVVALWLANRAEDEIFVDDTRFGGVGIYRAAQIISIVVIVVVAVSIVAAFLLNSHPNPGP